MADVNVAESSTAVEVPVEQLNSDQRQAWLEKGDLPKVEPVKEESATSSEPATAEEAAPASEAGKQQPEGKVEDKGKGAEARKAQLNAEIRELLKKRDSIRKETEAKTAEPPTAKTPKEPVLDDFDTLEAYDKAMREYYPKLAEFKASEAIEKYKADEAKRHETAKVEARNRELEGNWRKQIEAAVKKYPDFNDVAFAQDLEIPQGSVMDAFILESERGADILYHLGKDREELARISALGAIAQSRALVKLEDSLSETKPPAALKKVSSAPNPLSEVGGKNAGTEDEIKAALKADDFRAYKRAADAKDLARSKA